MKDNLKKAVKRSPLYSILTAYREMRVIKSWEKEGRPVPPPHVVKQRAIRELAKRFGLRVLVETGTFEGEMVEAMRGSFDLIYSIELGEELYENAKRKFAGDPKIEIVHGDSGVELGKLLARIDQPALFWLDGHYSGGGTAKGRQDTPIYEELKYIFSHPQKRHVVIIDDARCFGSDRSYPTVEELVRFVNLNSPAAEIAIKDDSIRITSPDRRLAAK